MQPLFPTNPNRHYIMKRTLCLALLLFGALSAFGQSLTDIDLTYLSAIKGNDIVMEKLPLQIAIVPYDLIYGEEGEDLRHRMEEMADRVEQNFSILTARYSIEVLEQSLATMTKQREEYKDNPALLSSMDENIQMIKDKLVDLKASASTGLIPYSQSLAQLTKEVLAIALNHRFYSAADKLDNDNWIVCDGNRLNDDPENKDQEWYFRYGIIDPTGKTLIPCIYHINGFLIEKDIYFVCKKVNDKVYGGAVNGHGKVIIPFDYANVRILDSEHNLVVIEDHNYHVGLMNMNGKLLLPAEYDDYYATDNGFFFSKGDKTFFVDYNGKATERQ